MDTYLKILDSEETHKAMAFDGVKRETVKIAVLDRSSGLVLLGFSVILTVAYGASWPH